MMGDCFCFCFLFWKILPRTDLRTLLATISRSSMILDRGAIALPDDSIEVSSTKVMSSARQAPPVVPGQLDPCCRRPTGP